MEEPAIVLGPKGGGAATGAFRLAGSGLRFVEPATERAYRAWHQKKAVPFNRAGLVSSAFNWGLLLLGWYLARLPALGILAQRLLLTMAPTLLVGLLATYKRGLLRWMLPITAMVNAVAGLLLVWMMYRLVVRPDVALAAIIINAFVGFVILRLRPAQAAVATVIGLGVHEAFLVDSYAAGRVFQVELVAYTVAAVVAFFTGLTACIMIERVSRGAFRDEQIIEQQRTEIERARARADELLHSILPTAIAERLKVAPQAIAEGFEEVTVLFADLVGFTPLAARLGPGRLVELLNEVFSQFDDLVARHGVEKIKTIGDAYMAASGVPQRRDDHAEALAELALGMKAVIDDYNARYDHQIAVRIGLCSGAVVAGVIGARRFAYDLWGDTVNTAARMESHGLAGQIQVSESTFLKLRERYELSERGVIDVKGKGPMRTWFLAGRLEVAPRASA